MRARASLVGLALAPLVLAVACTGSSPTPRPPTLTSSSFAHGCADSCGGYPFPYRPPAPNIPGAVQGGTLTVLSSDAPKTLDPGAVAGAAASFESGLLIRSLTQYVYQPESHTMRLVPDLATNLGTPTSDYKTWRYTVRSGVEFENGRPVTAEDVRNGIARAFAPAPFQRE